MEEVLYILIQSDTEILRHEIRTKKKKEILRQQNKIIHYAN